HLELALDEFEEGYRVEFGLAAVLADGVDGGAQEVVVSDAGDLDGILEGEEDALAGALLGVHVQQVLALVKDFAHGDGKGVAAGEDTGQGALAGAVGPHDGVDLAGVDREVDAAEDFFVLDAGVQVLDFEHGRFSSQCLWGRSLLALVAYPTLPSRLTPSS